MFSIFHILESLSGQLDVLHGVQPYHCFLCPRD
jgi:hypothetical protein